MPAEQRGQVILVKMESTGNRRNSCLGGSPAGLPWGGTSRMRREFHVRICEGLGVKFPGPTRRIGHTGVPTAILKPASPGEWTAHGSDIADIAESPVATLRCDSWSIIGRR